LRLRLFSSRCSFLHRVPPSTPQSLKEDDPMKNVK
jgi:hypothetical protein